MTAKISETMQSGAIRAFFTAMDMPQSRFDENQYFIARTVVERDSWVNDCSFARNALALGFDNSCMCSAKSSSSGTRMLSLRLFDDKSVKMVPESVIEA
jgi:hypothetical protein